MKRLALQLPFFGITAVWAMLVFLLVPEIRVYWFVVWPFGLGLAWLIAQLQGANFVRTIPHPWFVRRRELSDARRTAKYDTVNKVVDTFLLYAIKDNAEALEIRRLHLQEPVTFSGRDGSSFEVMPDGEVRVYLPTGEYDEFRSRISMSIAMSHPHDAAPPPVTVVVCQQREGELYYQGSIPEFAFTNFTIIVKHRAGLDPVATGIPQSGEFTYEQANIHSRWRADIIPTEFGDEKVVLDRIE